MYNLSEQAQKLIADFEKRIETVPADERSAVLKRMTSHIATLNEDAESLFKVLQDSKDKREPDGPHTQENDADHIRDFI